MGGGGEKEGEVVEDTLKEGAVASLASDESVFKTPLHKPKSNANSSISRYTRSPSSRDSSSRSISSSHLGSLPRHSSSSHCWHSWPSVVLE